MVGQQVDEHVASVRHRREAVGRQWNQLRCLTRSIRVLTLLAPHILPAPHLLCHAARLQTKQGHVAATEHKCDRRCRLRVTLAPS
jgi:hypothetical protein